MGVLLEQEVSEPGLAVEHIVDAERAHKTPGDHERAERGAGPDAVGELVNTLHPCGAVAPMDGASNRRTGFDLAAVPTYVSA